MIDTHTHVNSSKIKSILAGSDLNDSKENIIKAKKYVNLWAAVGIHPQVDIDNIDKAINFLNELISDNKRWVVAVGECGLDYSPAPPGEKNRSKTNQEKLFRGQIGLSVKYNLPLIIHARKAVDETIGLLSQYPKALGVFHCFSGGKKRIAKVLELGANWYFGIDGNLTYEDGLVEVVKNIPKDRLVLETDSPFLAPVPHRGETNKPEYVEFVYKKMAEIWQMDLAETEKIVDSNATKLFGLDVRLK